jgi:hypothetical protein
MKKLKRLTVVAMFAVLTCIALVVNSQELVSNKKPAKEKSIIIAVCDLFPFFCPQSTRSGNGDGEEPPRPKKHKI